MHPKQVLAPGALLKFPAGLACHAPSSALAVPGDSGHGCRVADLKVMVLVPCAQHAPGPPCRASCDHPARLPDRARSCALGLPL